jgi:hypothetical protein
VRGEQFKCGVPERLGDPNLSAHAASSRVEGPA